MLKAPKRDRGDALPAVADETKEFQLHGVFIQLYVISYI
jgi:hypothetical protein